MGTDIHMVVERRDSSGKWHGLYKDDGWHCFGLPPDEEDVFDVGRNYHLFAVLCGVRNSTGLKPISEPRGVPSDASREFHEMGQEWSYGHSASHVTLAELLAYDWNAVETEDRLTDASGFVEWKESGGNEPGYHCGGVGGAGVRVLSHEGMERAIASHDTNLCYTRVSWTHTRTSLVGDRFVKDTIPELCRLSRSAAHDDVRLVFFFDS